VDLNGEHLLLAVVRLIAYFYLTFVFVVQKLLSAQVEQLQGFMLRINEESFRQGVRRVAFFHGVPDDDERYDSNMDVVGGRLMPLGDEEAEDMPRADDTVPPEESMQPDDNLDIV